MMDKPLAQSESSQVAIGVLKQVIAKGSSHPPQITHTLALDAEERTRSRLKFTATDGTIFKLELPRGTVLAHGDLLQDVQQHWCVRVEAKPEPVITVRSADNLTHIRAAYHLGNRHVPLEITADYLRFSPDKVLEDMVKQMGLTVVSEVAPFQPESGAYHSHSSKSVNHSHSHSSLHSHSHNHIHQHDHDHSHHPQDHGRSSPSG